jgi:hypothetical protein
MPKARTFTLYNTFIGTAVERIISYFWSKLAIKETGDHNHDYGNHTSILNFPSPPQGQHEHHHPTSNQEQNNMKKISPQIQLMVKQGLQLGKKGLTSFLVLLLRLFLMEQELLA